MPLLECQIKGDLGGGLLSLAFWFAAIGRLKGTVPLDYCECLQCLLGFRCYSGLHFLILLRVIAV